MRVCFLQRVGHSSSLTPGALAHLHLYLRINLQESFLSIVVAPAAPRPISGMLHKFLFHGISVHIVEFFLHLRLRVHVEIVIPSLPESSEPTVDFRKRKPELALSRTLSSAHPARQSLLEHLNDLRRAARTGFAEQQVDVLGHDYVSHKSEPISPTDFLENLDCQIPGAHRTSKARRW